MPATTVRKPASNKPTARLLRVLYRHPGETFRGAVRLAITYARRTDLFRYWVEQIPSDFGLAFQFEKVEPDGEVREVYHVCLENEQDASCTCPGGTYGGACKHIDAAKVIAARERVG